MARIRVPAYNNYYGGKSGSGTYQSIINRIPPHKVFFSLCLGNCGITRHIRPAEFNFLNDIDSEVIASWEFAVRDHNNYTLLCNDAEDVLRYLIANKYDTAETFIYIDLPYLFSTRKGQRPVCRYEADEQKHLAIIQAAKALKFAKVMFSHYPNDLYDQELAGWHTFDFWSTTRKGQALERIYFNYQLTDKLHDYSYIGDDFREREALSRIKKNFIKKLNYLDPQLRNSILQDLTSQKNALAAVSRKFGEKKNGLSVDFIIVDEARDIIAKKCVTVPHLVTSHLK